MPNWDSEEKIMEDSPTSPSSPSLTASSPRRTLSLLRKRRGGGGGGATVSIFSGPDSNQGPKPSEVYGFVGSITTVVATVVYLVWAYVPESWLHSIGITYYPSKYWALAIPAFAMVTAVLGLIFYVGLNFMVTPPPTSYSTMFDEYSRERSVFAPSIEGADHPIEPYSDIGITEINDAMFGQPL